MWDFLAWIFPNKCVGCSALGAYLCRNCLNKVHFYQHPICPGCNYEIAKLGIHKACIKNSSLDGLIATSRYEGVMKQFVRQIKYRGYFNMIPSAAKILAESVSGRFDGSLVITSVPLHTKRLRVRGFNQSELLARELAKILKLPYSNLIVKKRATKQQAELNRQARLVNLDNAFEITKTPPKKLILVDDVCTTGATLSACAKTLKKSGSIQVYGLVLCHGV